MLHESRGGAQPLATPGTSTSYQVPVCADLLVPPASLLRLGEGAVEGQGGTPPTPPLPLPGCSQARLDPKRCLVLGPGGTGGSHRALGVPPSPPPFSGGVLSRALLLGGVSSPPPPPATQSSWLEPPHPGKEVCIATPCRPALLGNGGWQEGHPKILGCLKGCGRLQPSDQGTVPQPR